MHDAPKSLIEWLKLTISVAGFATAWIIFFWNWNKNRKSLIFDYTAGEISTPATPFSHNLKIVYAGEEISDASLISITMRNAGGVSIERKDFDEDICFRFDEHARVLAFKLAENTTTEGLIPVLSISDSGSVITLKPTLLNRGDQFTLLALVSGFKEGIKVAGRVAGVGRIERRRMDVAKPELLLISRMKIWLLCVLSVYYVSWARYSERQIEMKVSSYTVETAIAILINVILLFLVVWKRFYRQYPGISLVVLVWSTTTLSLNTLLYTGKPSHLEYTMYYWIYFSALRLELFALVWAAFDIWKWSSSKRPK